MKLGKDEIFALVILGIIFIYILIKSFPLPEKLPTQPTTTLTTTTTTLPRENKFYIYPSYYEPPSLEIKSGEEVKWINKDNKTHTLVLVYLNDSKLEPIFQIDIPSENNLSWSFFYNGTYNFWDPDVKGMEGELIVK